MLKNTYFKKHQDEVWGHIIRQKTYSYTKKLVLASYKLNFLKAKFYMQKKFAYHKPLFLKVLKKTLFNFKFFKKIYRFITKTEKPVVFNLTKFTNSVLFRKKEPYKFKHLILGNKFFYVNFSLAIHSITIIVL